MTEQVSKNPYEQLEEEVLKGIEGQNEGISIGLPKLGKYASFRKRIFTLIFSSSGAGKSSLIDTMMLNACDSMIAKKEKRAKFILFSMERSKHLRVAKWITRKIFLDTGIEIPLPKLLGWWDQKLNKEELELFQQYRDYVELLLTDYIDIYEGARTPNEIYHIIKEYFLANGIYEKVGEHKTIYLPNDENKLTIPIVDTGNLTRITKDFPTKKQAIDATVAYLQRFRDLEGASPVWVSQIKRELSTMSRSKEELSLSIDDVKESGDVGDACDIAISMLDCAKFKQSSKTGYNAVDFIDKNTGANYFRDIQINKSSYGEDSLFIPTSFMGATGDFKELPRKKDLDEYQYKQLLEDVLSKKYFLK